MLEHFCALTTEAEDEGFGETTSLDDGTGPLVGEREERLRREGERDPPTTPTGAIGHAKCYAAIPDAKQKNQVGRCVGRSEGGQPLVVSLLCVLCSCGRATCRSAR